MTLGDLVQLAGDTFTRERVIDHNGQALPAEVVNDAQDTKAPAINQDIRDEVQASALIGALRNRHRRTCPQGPLTAATLAHG